MSYSYPGYVKKAEVFCIEIFFNAGLEMRLLKKSYHDLTWGNQSVLDYVCLKLQNINNEYFSL